MQGGREGGREVPGATKGASVPILHGRHGQFPLHGRGQRTAQQRQGQLGLGGNFPTNGYVEGGGPEETRGTVTVVQRQEWPRGAGGSSIPIGQGAIRHRNGGSAGLPALPPALPCGAAVDRARDLVRIHALGGGGGGGVRRRGARGAAAAGRRGVSTRLLLLVLLLLLLLLVVVGVGGRRRWKLLMLLQLLWRRRRIACVCVVCK